MEKTLPCYWNVRCLNKNSTDLRLFSLISGTLSAKRLFSLISGLNFSQCIQYITLRKLRELISSALHTVGDKGSFYVTSRADVRSSVATWKRHLPTITPYYAVKSNPEPTLLHWLYREGVRFDCASVREIDAVLDVGASHHDIVYANPCKRLTDIEHAQKVGVARTVVDSYEEIDKVVDARWRGDSFLRIRVDDTRSVVPFGRKFGISPNQVGELSRHAVREGLPLAGISFHVGSGCKDPSQYIKAILSASVSLNVLKQSGHPAHTIDIGGGFVDADFQAAATAIRTVRGYIPSELRLIAEPGRYFSAGSQSLFVQVIGKKAMSDGSPGYRYTIDESLYGQFSCIPFDCARPTWIRVGEDVRKRMPAILYGRTCDSVDMIAMTNDTEELFEGDWLLFPNMGAYTSVTSSEFNGFPRPPLITLPENQSMRELILPSTTAHTTYVTPVIVPENLSIDISPSAV